jgi:hypothetical protein
VFVYDAEFVVKKSVEKCVLKGTKRKGKTIDLSPPKYTKKILNITPLSTPTQKSEKEEKEKKIIFSRGKKANFIVGHSREECEWKLKCEKLLEINGEKISFEGSSRQAEWNNFQASQRVVTGKNKSEKKIIKKTFFSTLTRECV